MIEVLNSGFYSTIQDKGRVGFRSYGVPVSGAMDSYSAQLANALVGNNEDAAILEIYLTGPKLLFNEPTLICVSGADMSARLNDSPIKPHHALLVNSGDILSFGKLNYGCRAYIAVSGGFQTDEVLKSRSFYNPITPKSSIENGDKLKSLPHTKPDDVAYASIKFDNAFFSEKKIDVFKGPEFDLLAKSIQKKLGSQWFTISKNNNRMGYQLEELLDHKLASILTAPVLPGTVQLTPSGRLIVLMKDGQTTGGYPRVLQLMERSINALAQKKAGDSIQFNLS